MSFEPEVSDIADKPSRKGIIEDEPGAEDRFLRGVRKAVKTPPNPFTPSAKDKDKGKDGNRERSK